MIVFDEFQNLCKTNPAFASVVQRIWDEKLKNHSFMLILSGSLVGMMQEHALSYSSPLYGRRTGQIKLKQFSFKDAKEFFLKCQTTNLYGYIPSLAVFQNI